MGERCRWLRWSVVALALLARPMASRADGPPPGVAPVPAAEVRWPGEGGGKIRVSLGIYLIGFARINPREESFDMAGYLDVSWTDPTRALAGSERRGRARRYRPGQVWAPALEFVNAVEQVAAEREGDVYLDDDGRATQRIRFSHKFQSPMLLGRFPFDRQLLSASVAPFDPFARDLELVVDAGRVGKLSAASATDWDIGAVAARLASDPAGHQRLVFEVAIRRRSTFYVWRVLLPMTLLVAASWMVFWFDPTVLQPQSGTVLAILLSLVTFNYAIDFSLPKVAYLTFIDRYTLNAFAFVLATLVVVAAIHVLIRAGRDGPARRLQARARVLFPLAFLASVAAIALSSLA